MPGAHRAGLDGHAPPQCPPSDGRLALSPDAIYPAAPYQRLLWSVGAAGAGFTARCELEVEGAAPEAIAAALKRIVARHGALRTRLEAVPHAPFVVQHVADDAEVENDGRTVRLSFAAAVVDLSSFRIIARELATDLGGGALDPDPVQFVEYSDWRNEVVGTAAFSAAVTHSEATPHTRAQRPAGPAEADTVLAAWMIHLWRQGAEPTVACAVDGRAADPSLAGVVGRCEAYLPVTVALEDDTSFAAAIERVRAARATAAAIGEAGLVGAPPCADVFDVEPGDEPITCGGVTVRVRQVSARTLPFARRLAWSPTTLTLEQPAAERALDGLAAMLEASPDTPIGALPVIGAAERAWLAEVSTGPERPVGETTLARIVAAGRAHPERLAVRDHRSALRYEDLLARAGGVARALAARGIGRGDAVVVVADRSVWSVVALLAAQLAGAAYAPLDEGVPAGRLETILADCRTRVVIARAAIPLPADTVRVDPEQRHEGLPAVCTRTLDDVAYILYTSGSTGRPKGVVVSDRGLANYVGWAAEHYGLGEPGEALVTSPFGFDLTITTALAPLTVGGTIVVASTADPLDALTGVAREHGVRALKLTPRHLDLLANHLDPADAVHPGTVVVGGEPLTRSTVERWRRLAGDGRIVNEYGPTETVVGSAFHDVPLTGDDRADVPIGRPIANTSLYVLDHRLRLVPTGVVGELFIGGAGVARGYLGAPGLTAERFLPDPVAGDGSRMYRTGDLVRREHDGELTFVARADDQLKLRGYRVEPGEVEQVLVAAGVRAAAVVPSGQALVAFVVADGAFDEQALLARAAAALPEYMVPVRTVRVDALPLTGNGKLDRARLAAGVRQRQGAATAPETELERLVEEVWRTVLCLDFVGVDESFFEVGGESLLAVEVTRRLQERLDRPLRVVSLFEHPTVRRLAAHLAGAESVAVRAGAERAAKRARARGRA